MSHPNPLRICFLSGISSVVVHFYGDLLKTLRDQGADLCVVSSDDERLQKFSAETNCPVFPVTITRKMTPIGDVRACLKIFRFFRKSRFDLLHVHTPKGGVIGLVAAFLARLPVRVYTIHGLPMETASGMSRRVLWLMEKLSCSLATRVLAVSESLREKVIQEKLCPPHKISVLGSGTACGIEIERFCLNDDVIRAGRDVRRRLEIPDTGIVVGFVGRMTPDKGVETLIDAFLRLEQQRPDVWLLLAGPLDKVRGTFAPALLETIAEHPRIKAVLEHVDPALYFAAMDIVTLPSRREGFGLTLLEAGAMQRPVVATRVTGCVDAVVDGRTGFLVPPDSPEAFAEAITTLLESNELRDAFGMTAKKRVLEKFSRKDLVQAHLAFYETLRVRNN